MAIYLSSSEWRSPSYILLYVALREKALDTPGVKDVCGNVILYLGHVQVFDVPASWVQSCREIDVKCREIDVKCICVLTLSFWISPDDKGVLRVLPEQSASCIPFKLFPLYYQ